jgi:hypothetical protein
LPSVGPVRTLGAHKAALNHTSRSLTILKIDIEGAEHEALLQMSDAELDSVGHLILEVHLGPADRSETSLSRKLAAAERVAKHFALYHSHINNIGGMGKVGDVPLPLAWELSYISKKAIFDAQHTVVLQQHPLDKTSARGIRDIGCECQHRKPCTCDYINAPFPACLTHEPSCKGWYGWAAVILFVMALLWWFPSRKRCAGGTRV